MKNLYPSIPIKQSLDLVEQLLERKEDLQQVTDWSVTSIMELLRWMFSLTYCEYNGKHYILDTGPIGLGVTGEVAIIYMEDFQIRARDDRFPSLENWW